MSYYDISGSSIWLKVNYNFYAYKASEILPQAMLLKYLVFP